MAPTTCSGFSSLTAWRNLAPAEAGVGMRASRVSDCGLREEGLARVFGDIDAGGVRALQQLPVIAVAGAVVQLALVADRAPFLVVGGDENLGGVLDLAAARLHAADDGLDLVRVDA